MRRGEKHISLSSLVFFFFLVVFHREQQEKKSWYVCTSHSTKYTQKLEKKASSKLTKMKLLYSIQIESFQPRYNFVFYTNPYFSTQIQFCILYKSRVFNLATILYSIQIQNFQPSYIFVLYTQPKFSTQSTILYFIQIQSFQPSYNFVFYTNLQFSTQLQFCIRTLSFIQNHSF